MFENRLRFLREVIASVRADVDDATVVGLRISGDEKDPEGLEDPRACRRCALGDLVDYVNVIAGSSAASAAQSISRRRWRSPTPMSRHSRRR